MTEPAAIAVRDKIVMRKLADLKPYERNARTHSAEQVEQVAASIREFGFTQPLLIDENDGIVAGHCRALAAQQLGMLEVPTITLGKLTRAQVRAYVLADNKLALNASWDYALLSSELIELDQVVELDLLGFNDVELQQLQSMSDAEMQAQSALAENPMVYSVIAECQNEKAQTELLGELEQRGFKCRLLIS